MISPLISIMRLVFLPAVSNPQLWIFLKDLRYHSGNLHLGSNCRLQMNHMLICLEIKKTIFFSISWKFSMVLYRECWRSMFLSHDPFFFINKEKFKLDFFSSSFSFRSKINSIYVVFEYLWLKEKSLSEFLSKLYSSL